MRGLYEGEYQFVPPCCPGQVVAPGGCGVWIGRPFSSSPLAQFTLTNGLPSRNLPVDAIEHVEESVAVGQHHQLRAARPATCVSASTGTCVESQS